MKSPYMAHLTPLRPLVTAFMLALRRRHLERQTDGPFDPTISLELDAMIVEEEA